MSELFSSRQAAQQLGLSDAYLRQLSLAGRLGKRVGGRWIYEQAELNQFRKIPRAKGRPKRAVKDG